MLQKLSAQFYNINMSSRRLPHKKDLVRLLNIYKHAPRPILVHCKGGADRTGEAAALWVLDQQKKRKKDALKQLSIWYWHIRFKFPSKRFFIKLWKGRQWALHHYDPTKYKKYYPIEFSY